jgi:hypothetical protein
MPERVFRILFALAAVGGACARLHAPVTVDPDATFAAHLEHDGLRIDRLGHAQAGTIGPASWFRGPGAAAFVVETDGERQGALWVTAERVVVRTTAAECSPSIGEVSKSWDDGAIRLTIHPNDGPVLQSDVLRRSEPGGGPDELTRNVQIVLDVRGKYEAPVREPNGTAVGWLRVAISPYQPAARIYQASLPTSVPPALTAATAVALDGEIDWIEAQAINVYQGNHRTGPLQESVPLTH